MVHDYSFFGSTADFVIKKEHLGFLPDLAISKRQTSGRNMTVELRQPTSAPSKNWMGKNEDLTDFKGDKMENFADTSAFNAGVKEKNTKTDKITIVKNQKLATQNFFLTCIYIFPLVTYKDSLLWNMLKYEFMKYRHRQLYYRVAPIYTRYTLYTTKKKTKLTNVITVP